MSTALGNEDLVPEQTEGFKVGEKKTIDEYQKLGESSIY
jgi:Rho GDP-dissociation inhibitor